MGDAGELTQGMQEWGEGHSGANAGVGGLRAGLGMREKGLMRDQE